MTLLLVGQLFTYESFHEVLIVSQGNLGSIAVTILIVLLPIYELAALPALLSMNLPSDIIRASAYVARAVSLLVIALALNAWMVVPGASTGLLGDTVHVSANILTLLAVVVFAGAIWYATIKQVEQPKKK